MNRILFMIVAFFSLPTAVVSAKPNYLSNIAPEFLPYVVAFKRDYYKYLHKTLTLGEFRMIWEKGGAHGGVCTKRQSTGEWWISIPEDGGWKIFSECQREELIYHELGHCVLNEDHSEFGFMHNGVRNSALCENTRETSKKYLFEKARLKSKLVETNDNYEWSDE